MALLTPALQAAGDVIRAAVPALQAAGRVFVNKPFDPDLLSNDATAWVAVRDPQLIADSGYGYATFTAGADVGGKTEAIAREAADSIVASLRKSIRFPSRHSNPRTAVFLEGNYARVNVAWTLVVKAT